MEKTAILIVLYYPNMGHLTSCLERLHLQDSIVILVDNTPEYIDLRCLKKFNVEIIQNLANLGIAAAQNIGIRKAKELLCDYVVFFDQDSDISGKFVEGLLSEYKRLQMIYSHLATLGPRVINKSTGEFYKEADEDVLHDAKIVSTLISSGSIIPMRVLDDVGYMEERLFIDYVDFEWAWRAQRKGYICCLTNRLHLHHQVGSTSHTLCGSPIIISAA